MDRYAANTLRTLALIFTSVVMIAGAGVLSVFTYCAFTAPNQIDNSRFTWLGSLIGLLIVGIVIVAVLARQITRGGTTSPVTDSQLAPRRMPTSAMRTLRVVVALQIILGGISAVSFSSHLRPNIFFGANASAAFMISSIVVRVPYLVLLVMLFRKLDPRVLAFALAMPVLLFIPTLLFLFRGSTTIGSICGLGAAVLNLMVPYLAWRAANATDARPAPKLILIAAAVTFLYFGVVFLLPASHYYVTELFHA